MSGDRNRWAELPGEVQQLIFQFLSGREIAYFCAASQYTYGLFHRVSEGSIVWRNFHEVHFGKADGDEDLKEQTIAEFLYREACSAKRPDERQRLFCHLFQYLAPYHKAPSETKGWASYYFGEMYWQGIVVKQNKKTGVGYLNQCNAKKSRKAPLLVAKWLHETVNKNASLMLKSYSETVIADLISLYESGCYEAACWLGHLYSKGAGPHIEKI